MVVEADFALNLHVEEIQNITSSTYHFQLISCTNPMPILAVALFY